jgi:MbtH protein
MTDTRADDIAVDDELYFVVRNHEEQYSIWRTDKPVPAGWDVVGDPDARSACLDRIAELWTDMRPASLRRAMDGEG